MIIHWSIRLTNEMMVIQIIVPRYVQSGNPTLDSESRLQAILDRP